MFTNLSLYSDLGIIKVTGQDAATFLHNQLSNDIANLSTHQACYATYNTPQGRIISNFVVLKLENTILLVLPKSLIEKVIKRLRMFVLRSDVQFADCSQLYDVAAQVPQEQNLNPNSNPLTFDFQEKDNVISVFLPHQGVLHISDINDFGIKCKGDIEIFKNLEISQGYPLVTNDTSETCVAQMLNQHTLGAVNFKKGCYPGQEIIARAQYRGKVKRGMVYCTSKTIINVGEAVFDDENSEVGFIINTSNINNEYSALIIIKHIAYEKELYTQSGAKLIPQKYFFNPAE